MNLPADIIKMISMKLDKWSFRSFILTCMTIHKILYCAEVLMDYFNMNNNLWLLFKPLFNETSLKITYGTESYQIADWHHLKISFLKNLLNPYYKYKSFRYIFMFILRGTARQLEVTETVSVNLSDMNFYTITELPDGTKFLNDGNLTIKTLFHRSISINIDLSQIDDLVIHIIP